MSEPVLCSIEPCEVYTLVCCHVLLAGWNHLIFFCPGFVCFSGRACWIHTRLLGFIKADLARYRKAEMGTVPTGSLNLLAHLQNMWAFYFKNGLSKYVCVNGWNMDKSRYQSNLHISQVSITPVPLKPFLSVLMFISQHSFLIFPSRLLHTRLYSRDTAFVTKGQQHCFNTQK